MVAKAKYAKAGKPRIYQSPEAMQEDIEQYFAECDLLERPYLISGLVLALDFAHRSALVDYAGYSAEFHNIIARARLKCQAYAEAQCYEKQSQGPQFILNAGHGWSTQNEQRTRTEVEISLGEDERELLQAMGSKLIESRIVASVPSVAALTPASVPIEPMQGDSRVDAVTGVELAK